MSNQVVPQGYKNSKVGVIPDEWEEVLLSSFVNEKIIYCNDEKINLGSLTIEKGVIPKPTQYKREHLVKDINNAYKLIGLNDFAYNPMNLRFGALALYTNRKLLKVSAYYNIFDVDKKIVDIDYIYSYLKSERIMSYYNRMAIGSLEEKKRVHFKEFKKFIFPIPPLKEQKKIAKILTTWDNAISKQEELIKAKEQLKKGFMQKLLSGEVRFDGFSGEWESIKLGKIGNISTGTTPSTKIIEYYKNGTIPWITPTDITNKKDIYTSNKLLTDIGLKKGRLIKKNSLLVTCIASIGKNTILRIDGSCNQQINAICVNKNNDIDFLYYLIEYNKNVLIRYAGQGGMMMLNKSDFSNLKFLFPLLQEQQKIAQVLSTADKEIELLKNKLENLKKQKKGLMQRLLSGEVRVKG